MKWVIIILFILSQSLQAQSDWTVSTLKEYTDQRFESVQEAVNKAEMSTEKRFEGVNEFRLQLADQQRTFVSKAEYEASHASLINQVNEIKAKLDQYENLKVGGNNTIAYLMAGISFIIAIIALSRNFIASIYRTTKRDV